jgi:hypothetical protein
LEIKEYMTRGIKKENRWVSSSVEEKRR